MKKVMLILFVILTSQAKAQDYKTGIGIRGGLSNGITLKHFVKSNVAIEGILSMRWKGYNLTGLYEIHAQAFGVSGLAWYYGIGAHTGVWNGYDRHPWFNDDNSYVVVGIDGIIGLEYTIAEIPFSIGLDYKPGYNIIGHQGPWGDEAALSIRYTFR